MNATKIQVNDLVLKKEVFLRTDLFIFFCNQNCKFSVGGTALLRFILIFFVSSIRARHIIISQRFFHVVLIRFCFEMMILLKREHLIVYRVWSSLHAFIINAYCSLSTIFRAQYYLQNFVGSS